MYISAWLNPAGLARFILPHPIFKKLAKRSKNLEGFLFDYAQPDSLKRFQWFTFRLSTVSCSKDLKGLLFDSLKSA